MAYYSAIEWTDASWNPVTGCTKVSRGCDNCYAERFAERFRGVPGHPYKQGFDLKLHPNRLDHPLKWRSPRHIFVNSMSDLFHKNIPADFAEKVFTTMRMAHWHIFQVLTKRSSLMRKFVNQRFQFPVPPHIWLGVSVENRDALVRIEHLRQVNASVRFLSVEPLLEDIGQINLEGIHWVIVGGESGPGARPMRKEWVRNIREQCVEAEVPFFFKQWGGRTPKAGGRLLDGRHWDEMPSINTPHLPMVASK